MTKMDKPAGFSRRSLLKTGGALVVSVGMPIGLDTVVGQAESERVEAAAVGGSAVAVDLIAGVPFRPRFLLVYFPIDKVSVCIGISFLVVLKLRLTRLVTKHVIHTHLQFYYPVVQFSQRL